MSEASVEVVQGEKNSWIIVTEEYTLAHFDKEMREFEDNPAIIEVAQLPDRKLQVVFDPALRSEAMEWIVALPNTHVFSKDNDLQLLIKWAEKSLRRRAGLD